MTSQPMMTATKATCGLAPVAKAGAAAAYVLTPPAREER